MRQIYTVDAKQVVVSDNHPEGMLSNMPNYPKNFDSMSYNDDLEKAYWMAKADFLAEQSTLMTADNPNRVMWTVTLTRADGRQMMAESWGAFPDMTPTPEPEPEEA